MILASQMQEEEVGDGTNFVIVLAGSLLENAQDLLRMVNINLYPSHFLPVIQSNCHLSI